MIDQAGLQRIKAQKRVYFKQEKYGRDDDEPIEIVEKIERQTLRHSCGSDDGVLPG